MRNLYLFNMVLALLLLVCSVQAQAQTKVTGRVIAADDGTGLPGVSILEKGTTNGAVSDSEGNYSLSVSSNATLVYSFVGYASQEILVNGRTSIDVTLETDVTALNEVVVIGYGEVQKKDATGAVMNISNKDFNKGVITSPQDLLVGKFAGVAITSSSGAPGASSTIRIRGGSSLNASNDPLIVIDGFPVDNVPSTGAGSIAGVPNALAALNPNDIETFTVLKDASATAIYGSRASNGVIIVTTKKGKAGKPKLSYNGTVSVSTPIKYADVFTGDEYRALIQEFSETGISGINDAAVAMLGTASTDWQKEVYRDAFSHDHNVSLEGAYKSMPYRVSYGYTDQQGILRTTGFQRNSLNVNLNPSLLNDDLKLNISAKGSITDNNFGDAAAVGNALSMDPTQPIRVESDKFGGYYTRLRVDGSGLVNQSSTGNPVALLEQTDNTSTANRFVGSLQADYTLPFFRKVKATVNMGMDRIESEGHNIAGLDAGFTANTTGFPQGRRNTYDAQNESELLDIYANYLETLEKHRIDLTVGYGWQHFKRSGYTLNKNYEETITFTDLAFKNENYLVSFFGRLNYTFNDKWLLTATLRQDGSSRFSEDNRWGTFPSAAVGWKLKQEDFMAGVEFISDLKLRAGYGITGQQDISNNQYPYLPIYTQSTETAQYQLGVDGNGNPIFYPTLRPEAYDPDIKWEETETINAGIDFGLFENRLTGSIEVYQRKTSDLISTVPVPPGTNFSNFLTTNVGNLENKGFELQLNALAVEREDFTWNVGFNLTRNTNKITKLLIVEDPGYAGINAGFIAGGVGNYVQNQQVGYPINSFYVHRQVYDDAGAPIEGLYVDLSGKGGSVVGSDLNRHRDKKPAATVLMGINTRVDYKKFDFSFSGRISLDNYVYNNNYSSRAYYANIYKLDFFSNVPTAILDSKFNSAQYTSDYYLSNASFFKMDNISAGYTFDEFFTDKLRARFSLTVQNAFIVTDYEGTDPEVDGGIDNNIYPRSRSFLVGVNLTF
jgi:TonB-dependent starch-binding outer membrane protein SusC